MQESKHWRFPRYLIAVVVLAMHIALIAALLLVSGNGRLAASTANSIQLLYVAPVYPPKVRTLMANLPRRGSNLAITIEPPLLESQSFPISRAQGSTGNGEGSGVDWAAEARRALQAFEIRSHQPSASKSVSGRPEDDHWRPGVHYAGEKFKTATGDWIVWINANCYEIAGAGSGAYAHIAPLTEPVCQDSHPNAGPQR
jgi:hypothetical protein